MVRVGVESVVVGVLVRMVMVVVLCEAEEVDVRNDVLLVIDVVVRRVVEAVGPNPGWH